MYSYASKTKGTKVLVGFCLSRPASAYLALAQQAGLALRLADDKAAVVEAGAVLLQPSADETLVIAGQQVPEISVV